MNFLLNGPNRKRKARNRGKFKKSKLKKPPQQVFEVIKFESSDESDSIVFENLSPSKSNCGEFERILNLTPSKSEKDSSSNGIETSSDLETTATKFELTEDEDSLLNATRSSQSSVNQTSCNLDWSRSKFDEVSDEEESFSYGNIIEEFAIDRSELLTRKTPKKSRSVPKVKKTRKALEKKSKVSTKSENSKIQPNNLFDHDAQIHYQNNEILLILQKDEIVYLHGLCLLSILHGEVEILGHTLTKNSAPVKIYSIRGSSLLYLRNTTQSNIPISSYLKKTNQLQLGERSAIVFCQRLDDPQLDFIEKHISQQILPKEQILPRVVFQPREGNWNLLKVGKDWDEIIRTIRKETRLMICGGKGVGKTTFLRYAINKLLMEFKEVTVVDLDPGQSEFTIPGAISIVRIKEPIFGCNLCHLQTTDRSILSNISIVYEPDKYISSVRELIRRELGESPTLINYMGYTHGVGLNILSAVICHIQPTDILQISSTQVKKNYKFILEPNVVGENAKLFINDVPDLNYNLIQTQTMTDSNNGWIAESRALREMCILAYISKMIESESLFRSRAPMFRINLNDIILSDLNGEVVHPAAINANLVALCRLENEELHIFECLTWGIVRGIDLVANELVLITSETLEILDQVTHLVSNNGVVLPPSIYMTPDDVDGAMPYVIEGTLMSFGQIPKRSRVSVKQTKTKSESV